MSCRAAARPPRSPASTVGAILVSNLDSGAEAEAVDVARVHFRPIPADVRQALVEEGQVFAAAGGLMVRATQSVGRGPWCASQRAQVGRPACPWGGVKGCEAGVGA